MLTAAARGPAFLRSRTLRPTMPVHAPLWHDKDLYTPTAVVDAAVVGALHLADPPGARAGRCGGHREPYIGLFMDESDQPCFDPVTVGATRGARALG